MRVIDRIDGPARRDERKCAETPGGCESPGPANKGLRPPHSVRPAPRNSVARRRKARQNTRLRRRKGGLVMDGALPFDGAAVRGSVRPTRLVAVSSVSRRKARVRCRRCRNSDRRAFRRAFDSSDARPMLPLQPNRFRCRARYAVDLAMPQRVAVACSQPRAAIMSTTGGREAVAAPPPRVPPTEFAFFQVGGALPLFSLRPFCSDTIPKRPDTRATITHHQAKLNSAPLRVFPRNIRGVTDMALSY